MRTTAWILLNAVVALSSCAHTDEMTGDEHRMAASQAQQKAQQEQQLYDPKAAPTEREVASKGLDVFFNYNPTDKHLAEADRQMKLAFEHLQYAEKLEHTEELACADVAVAERKSCPLLAPHVDGVREVTEGVTLHLKPGAPTQRLVGQLRCHLAFAKANDFARVPCPLFIKGVTIALRGPQDIDVFSSEPTVAAQVRIQARRMFGEVGDPVTDRR